MAYGTVKVDNITFDNGGSDQNVTVSGLYRATTSGVTLSGTIAATTVSGVTVIGSTTVSGATVTGTIANFTSGNFSNIISSAATMSGALIMANQQQIRFREAVGNGVNHIALQAPAIVSADQTITLPDQTGTVITTGDNGSVSSTMLATNLTISAAAGTAAAPSIAFTGDTNTGIYSPGADQLAVSTGGTGRLFVDSSGRVGIGTTNPGYALDVAASDTTAGIGYALRIRANATAGAGALQFTDSGVSTQYGMLTFGANGVGTLQADGASSRLVFGTNSTERLRIDSSGNVGVGTSSPAAKLHVETIPQAISQSGSVIFGPNTSYGYEIRNVIDGSGYPRVELRAPTAGTGPMLFYAAGAKVFYDGGTTEQMRIDSSGRVGIGTSSPQAKLHIYNIGVSGTAYQPAVFIRNDSGGGNANNPTGLGAINWQTEGFDVANIEAVRDLPNSGSFSSLVFRTNASNATTGAGTERMRITSAGTVNTFSSTTDAFVSRSSSAAGTTNYNIRCTYAATGALDGTVAFQVSTNGNVTNTNNSYGAISDIKLKENIVDATSQWNDIKALQVRKYNFKEGQTHTQIGLVAQEVELVSPGLVTESPDRDEDGNDLGTVTKGVNYSVLYMKAVKALQEAMKRIETLEAAVAALQGA